MRLSNFKIYDYYEDRVNLLYAKTIKIGNKTNN